MAEPRGVDLGYLGMGRFLPILDCDSCSGRLVGGLPACLPACPTSVIRTDRCRPHAPPKHSQDKQPVLGTRGNSGISDSGLVAQVCWVLSRPGW